MACGNSATPRFIITFLVTSIVLSSALAGWYAQSLVRDGMAYDDLRERFASPAEPGRMADSDAGKSDEQVNTGARPYLIEANQRDIDWIRLSSINADIIGWIFAPGTPIDYPIVQAPQSDPDKYLHTTFEGTVSYPNNQGTIYLDADNEIDGLDGNAPVLYGHYQLNQSMFSAFSDNGDVDSLSQRANILIYTPSKMFHVELFAGNYVDAARERIKTSFSSDDELNAWIREKLDESEAVLYKPGRLDKLFTFVTCSYSKWQDQRTLSYGRVREVAPL